MIARATALFPKCKSFKKKSGAAGAAGWGSWVPLISIFGSPHWARLKNILLCERHPHRLSFGALVGNGFGNEGQQAEGTEGEALWAALPRVLVPLV